MEASKVEFNHEPICMTCFHRDEPEVCRWSKHGSSNGDRHTIETCDEYKFFKWKRQGVKQ